MSLLSDNTPLTNIITIAAASVVSVGAWFLLWRLVDLLHARFKRPAPRDGDGVMDTLRAVVVAEQLLAIQSGTSALPRRFDRPPAWTGPLFLVIAAVLSLFALLSFANTLSFVLTAVSVPGKVVALEQSQCGKHREAICYAPRVLIWETAGQRQVEFVSPLSSNPPAFHVDEQVTVLYSQGSPERARIKGFFSIWTVSIMLFGSSAIFAVVGVCSLLFSNPFASVSPVDPSSTGPAIRS
jgi:hypothetical protein